MPNLGADAALDRIRARQLMREQGAAREWQRRDPLGFEHAVNAVVLTAQAFVRAAAVRTPECRSSYWTFARESLSGASGPGDAERSLARLALEWAASTPAVPTDALFAMRPSAWIVVRAGGHDKLADALLANAGDAPCLLIDADPPHEDPFRDTAHVQATLAVCRDLEDEALQTAATVIRHLDAGVEPVALVSQDRLLIRRVRALLARRHVPLQDETGWKLSTTRAAASIMGLLRAANPLSTTDDWLDWLKSTGGRRPAEPGTGRGLDALESQLRQHGWTTPGSVDVGRLGAAAAAAWGSAVEVLACLNDAHQRPFGEWLDRLRNGLERCGAWAPLEQDVAGRQALAALHLMPPLSPDAGSAETMNLQEFTAWVDDALEDASFLPPGPADAAMSPVVITPLAGVALRPFKAIVLPGADEKRLGAFPALHPLLSDSLAAELDLTSVQERRDAETIAFVHACRVAHLDLLRRGDDGGEPLAASPLLERLAARDGAEGPQTHPGRERARTFCRVGAARRAKRTSVAAMVAGTTERERLRGIAKLPVPVLRLAAVVSARGRRAR